jgi:hypothetical protein
MYAGDSGGMVFVCRDCDAEKVRIARRGVRDDCGFINAVDALAIVTFAFRGIVTRGLTPM